MGGLLSKWGRSLEKEWNKITGEGARRRSNEDYARQRQLLEQLGEADLHDFKGEIPEFENLSEEGKRKLAGMLDYKQENLQQHGDTNFDRINIDPKLKEAQNDALSRFKQYAKRGTTTEDEAATQRTLDKIRQDDRGRREAIDAQNKRRGLSGSGLDIASKLSSQQAASDLGARLGLEQAQNRTRNKMAGAQMLGALSSQIRGQDYGEQRDLAGARDEIDRLNTILRSDHERNRVNRINEQQRLNLEAQQRVQDENARRADMQTQMSNQNRLQRYGLQRDRNSYNNRLRQQRNDNRNNNIRSRAGLYGQSAERNALDARESRGLAASLIAGGIEQGASALMGGGEKKKK